MKKQFYSHIVNIKIIEEELDRLDLSQKEQDELLQHVHSSIHYTVMDITLDSLSEEHKKTFLEHVNNNDHEKIWKHLMEHAVGIEEKIKNSTNNLVKEFLEDIGRVKLKA